MILEPIGDNIVVELPKEVSKENKTESGILLPKKTESEARKDIAKVVAVGTGRLLNDGTVVPPSVKPGDMVLYNKYAGTIITLGEDNYLLLKECDLLAILREEVE
jgi:chaperonin GroES